MNLLKTFLLYFFTAFMLFLLTSMLSLGLGVFFNMGYGILLLFVLGVLFAYGLFFSLTGRFNWKISVVQFLIIGLLTFGLVFLIERLFGDYLMSFRFVPIINILITAFLIITITVVIKLIFDKILKRLNFKMKEQKMKKYFSRK